jgi:hypothetical protein
MMIRREAFERLLRAKAEEPSFGLDWYETTDGERVFAFFLPFVKNDSLLSEDYAFVDRLARCGVDAWIDNRHRPGHVGRTVF